MLSLCETVHLIRKIMHKYLTLYLGNCPTGYFTKMMQSISGDDQFVCQKIQNCSETA